jgi:hypothetical protein
LRSITTGSGNVAIGSNYSGNGTSPLFAATTGSYNVGIGDGSLTASNSTGNTALGYGTGRAITSGNYNTFAGYGAGDLVTTGSFNIMLGRLYNTGITTGSYNTIIGSDITGLSSSLSNTIILADGQGNQRLYINSSGYVGIGTTNPTYNLYVQGQTLSTDGLSAGTDSYTGGYGLVMRAASGSSSQIYTLFGGSLGPQTIYTIAGATHRSPLIVIANNSGTEYARFDATSTSLLIGTNISAGYKLDVNGTARVSGMTTIATSTANTESLVITNSATGGSPYLKLGLWATLGQTFSSQHTIIANNCYPKSDGTTNWTRINAAKNASFININYDAIVFGSSINAASGSLETGGMYLVSNSLGIGIATPNASALLDVSSTTKGFLPPRMTNAQMVAIVTPAAGLVVYDTTNNKLNVYDGTNWVAVH